MEDFALSRVEDMWVEEKTSKDIAELPEDFYEKAANYATEIKREVKNSQDLRRELLEEELRHVLEMVQEIYLLRVLKMTDVMLEEGGENLLDSERKAFDDIRESLENLRAELIEPVVEGEPELEPPREVSNALILVLAEIPEPITATDMHYYGPFKEGDVANIPRKSADLLSKQGLARELEVKRS